MTKKNKEDLIPTDPEIFRQIEEVQRILYKNNNYPKVIRTSKGKVINNEEGEE